MDNATETRKKFKTFAVKEENIPIVKPAIVDKPLPPLVRLEEFIGSVNRQYRIESLGSFLKSMKKEVGNFRLPKEVWQSKLDIFLNRRVR